MANKSNTAPLAPELDDLVAAAQQVFGAEAVSDACDRAINRAAFLRDDDRDVWIAAFNAAWKDELRRLLQPH